MTSASIGVISRRSTAGSAYLEEVSRETTRQRLMRQKREAKIGLEVQKAVALLRPWAELPAASFPHWPWLNPNPWSNKLLNLGFQDGIVILIFLARLELDDDGSLKDNMLEEYDREGERIVTSMLAALLNTSLTSAMVLAACLTFAIGEMIRSDADEQPVFDDPVFLVHYTFTLITFMVSVGGVFASSVTYSALCVQLPDTDARVRHLRKNRLRIAATTYTIPNLQLTTLTIAVVLGAWTVSPNTGIIATATLPILGIFSIVYLAHTPYLILRDQHTIAREIFEIAGDRSPKSRDPISRVVRAGHKASIAIAKLAEPSTLRDGSSKTRFPWGRSKVLSRRRSSPRDEQGAGTRRRPRGPPGWPDVARENASQEPAACDVACVLAAGDVACVSAAGGTPEVQVASTCSRVATRDTSTLASGTPKSVGFAEVEVRVLPSMGECALATEESEREPPRGNGILDRRY